MRRWRQGFGPRAVRIRGWAIEPVRRARECGGGLSGLLLLPFLVWTISACADSAGGNSPAAVRVLFSTDVANGLIDTHGAQGSCSISFDASPDRDTAGRRLDRDPFNADDNPCVDHGSESGSSLSVVPAQLVVALSDGGDQPLVRGVSGVGGNIPDLGPARDVTVCVDFADRTARQEFGELLYEYTW